MDDLISRQAAIDAADKIIERDTSGNNAVVNAMIAWSEYIRALPTIEPRAKGKWDFIGDNMFMCTSCGAIYTVQQLECLKQHVTDLYIPPYCPNCGADMRWRDDD